MEVKDEEAETLVDAPPPGEKPKQMMVIVMALIRRKQREICRAPAHSHNRELSSRPRGTYTCKQRPIGAVVAYGPTFADVDTLACAGNRRTVFSVCFPLSAAPRAEKVALLRGVQSSAYPRRSYNSPSLDDIVDKSLRLIGVVGERPSSVTHPSAHYFLLMVMLC